MSLILEKAMNIKFMQIIAALMIYNLTKFVNQNNNCYFMLIKLRFIISFGKVSPLYLYFLY